MNALVINCSPVRDGATAEIVKIVSDCLGERYSTECACIDDYDITVATDPLLPGVQALSHHGGMRPARRRRRAHGPV